MQTIGKPHFTAPCSTLRNSLRWNFAWLSRHLYHHIYEQRCLLRFRAARAHGHHTGRALLLPHMSHISICLAPHISSCDGFAFSGVVIRYIALPFVK
jgi:hypothetical protein